MTVIQDIIVWIFIGLPVILMADVLCVLFEYYVLKPKSNSTMVAQLKSLAKAMSKKEGWKKEARQLEKLAKEVKKEETDVTPAT
jgi:Na+/melibiose symporter-like transporter